MLRGRPSVGALGSLGWVIAVAVVVVAGVAAVTYSLDLSGLVVVGSSVAVAIVAALVVARLARPGVVADGVGIRTQGQRPAGKYAWAEIVHVEPRYIDAAHATVVLHTATTALPLAATAGAPVEVAKVASRLDEHRIRARDLARR